MRQTFFVLHLWEQQFNLVRYESTDHIVLTCNVRNNPYIYTIAHFQRWIFREQNDSYPAVGEPKFAEHFSSDEVMAEPSDRFARSFGRKIGTQSGVWN